jgi:23S rRNA (guanosine2251-2'-O)-methyltransferase
LALRSELIFGLHSVRHALLQTPADALELWVQRDQKNLAVDEIIALASDLTLALHHAPRKTLDRLAHGGRHQGVVLRKRAAQRLDEGDLLALLNTLRTPPLLLILDGIQDPHNLGACLRTADATGANAVVIPLRRSVGLTATVSKVASGAVESMPVMQVGSLTRTLRELKEAGIYLTGTADDAPATLFETDLTRPAALVLGGEEAGLRPLVRELCDTLVRIPMRGQVESLNVSVAAGVCLYEALRQRSAAATPQSIK